LYFSRFRVWSPIKKLSKIKPDFEASDAQLLRYCRPIWEGKLLIAVARDQIDCQALLGLLNQGDVLLEPINFSGPTVVERNFGQDILLSEMVAQGKKYLKKYSKKLPLTAQIAIKNV